MTRRALVAPLLLLLLQLSVLLPDGALGQGSEEPAASPVRAPEGAQAEDETDDWGLNSLRGGLESVGGYFDSVLELMGGRDGVCQHRCRYGRAGTRLPSAARRSGKRNVSDSSTRGFLPQPDISPFEISSCVIVRAHSPFSGSPPRVRVWQEPAVTFVSRTRMRSGIQDAALLERCET